jgi:ribosomal protein L32
MIADPVTGDVSLYHRVNLETGMYRGVKVMKGRNEA